jgi:hypothetical protein
MGEGPVLGSAQGAPEMLPEAGARVHVDGNSCRANSSDGRLIVRVTPRPIEVSAEVPLNLWNQAEVDLAPGQSGSVEIALSDGKEVNGVPPLRP